MMYSLLLLAIYFAFLSMGLPDALLGAAWPSMRASFEVPLSYAGIISMLVTLCIIISSLSAASLTRRLGRARLVFASALLSALSLMGYAQADSIVELALFSIPYGLAAGAIDTSLNNYVALHYSARHMSWLHGIWGIGAATSPIIMSLSLSQYGEWQMGYWIVAALQLTIALGLLLCIPLWKEEKSAPAPADERETPRPMGNIAALKTPGVLCVLMCFFAYGSLEVAGGLWAASYLVDCKGLSPALASGYASLYFMGVVGGRFLCGFVAPYCSERRQILSGVGLMLLGVLLLLLPHVALVMLGLFLIGVGGAPICPALFHAIPRYFGEERSLAITGLQMAFSYLGASLMPPFMGLLAELAGLGIYPLYLGFWSGFVLLMMILLGRSLGQEKKRTLG